MLAHPVKEKAEQRKKEIKIEMPAQTPDLGKRIDTVAI
jgi:hypothetical protein